MDVRRRNSLPARFRRSSVLLLQQHQKRMSYQLKSNPYVGWFRHSPDTSPSYSSIATSWKQHQKVFLQSSSRPFHDSPYVGYFRHSPTASAAALTTADVYSKMFQAVEVELYALFKAFLPSLKTTCVQELADFLAGRLRGGGGGGSPWWLFLDEDSETNPSHRTTAATHPHSLTVLNHAHALSRIVGWILAPLIGEKEDRTTFKSWMVDKNQRGPAAAPEDSDDDHDDDDDDDDNTHDGEQEDDGDSDPDLEDARHSQPQGIHDDYQQSYVGSRDALSEAYYARQVTRELNPDEVIPSRLDFVITQMDIIRMQRNASRHLDVQSIYQLPTITYLKHHNNKTKKKQETINHDNHERRRVEMSETEPMSEESWSWMVVTEQEQSMTCSMTPKLELFEERMDEENEVMLEEDEDDNQDDVCVICLEHFNYGDRLRVLPCGHSFHMGCIDRWLSGSASFDDCDTAGCPMCKKRPTLEEQEQQEQEPHDELYQDEQEEEGELRPDGSVPSWAFSQLGSALLERDSQMLYSSTV